MYALLIILAGVATAYLVSRATNRAPLQPADLLLGLVGGLIGVGIGHQLGLTEAAIGLPLLVACGLTLGLSRTRTAHA